MEMQEERWCDSDADSTVLMFPGGQWLEAKWWELRRSERHHNVEFL